MKLNFKIKNDIAEVQVDPKIFSRRVVLRSAYKFIDRAWISLKKDDETGDIIVKFLPKEDKSEEDMKKIALDFDTNLITSYVEDVTAERYAESRNSMVKAALLSQTKDEKSEKDVE